MQELNSEKIPLDYVETHIRDHAKLLVEYVYCGETLSEEEYTKRERKIRDCSKQVVKLLKLVIQRKPLVNIEDEITTFYLICCLQAILVDKNNTSFEYDAYGLRNCKSRQVSGVLRENDNSILDSRRVYWEQKIISHRFANLGKYEAICESRKFQNICYDLMAKIYSAKNLFDMISIHKAIYEYLELNLSFFI